MKPHAVSILKKGLKKLQDQTRDRKVTLEAALKANEPISEIDEEWLDNAGNLVDEERLVDELDKVSNYESALKKLSPRNNPLCRG
jgi:hypothetical protein